MYKLIQKNRQHFSIILYIVVFIVCFALIFALMSGRKSLPFIKGSETPANMTDTPWMTLSVDESKPYYQVGDQIVVKLKADSLGAEITGYDSLISFDPTATEIVSVSSVKEMVDIYPHSNKDYISVTGVKRITESSQLIFHDDELISLVIKTKKPGNASISILPQKGNERTKMVDTSTNIIIPQVGSKVSFDVR